MVQAAGSWSLDACCAVHGNLCRSACYDRASSSNWVFGLVPGPPQRFQPTGTDTTYQHVNPDWWPDWGDSGDLFIGISHPGSTGLCHQGGTYRGTDGEICGGDGNWGAADLEVWCPR